MREIKPYKTLLGAQRSLDNGVRFYNVFARSGDDIVGLAELAKAAGVHSAGMKAFLHFEKGMMDLHPEQKDEIVARLSSDLLEKYKAQRPAILSPSSVESQGQSGKATIVSGQTVFVEDKTPIHWVHRHSRPSHHLDPDLRLI